jgi:site-specific DNA-methyltransferase (adenine-specific)
MSQIVINGNNIDILKSYPDNYFDAVVTDPPYGLGKEPNAAELMKDWIEFGYHEIKGTGFMGKEWDAFVPQPVFWKEVFRVLKHGGHVLSFFGTRTYDWGVMSMRFAGFEVRDCIQWLYGSGFPKSHNISKALDKMEGAEREVIGKKECGYQVSISKTRLEQGHRPNLTNSTKEVDITAPSTDFAKQWDGWGTALKPANEPIVLARKPLEKGLSVAENILKWGTGGINIDASRIGFKDDADYKESTQKNQHADFGTKPMTNNNVYGDYSMIQPKNYEPQGRFPANIILTHHKDCECKGNIHAKNGKEEVEDWECHEDCPIRILDEQSGVKATTRHMSYSRGGGDFIDGIPNQKEKSWFKSEVGGASRFFYVAKASKSERNKGLEIFEDKFSASAEFRPNHMEKAIEGDSGNPYGRWTPVKNFHPTVKPIKLMQYLVKMITPPNGIVLDPFCGSGTTGIACNLEGFQFVGMEQDAEYSKIAEARINNHIDKPTDNHIDKPTDNEPTINNDDKSQLTLF